MLSLDARGTIIKIQKDLAYKSEVLKKFIDGPYKKEDTYVLNYSPDIVYKLIDYLSDRYVFDFYLLDNIMDELIIEKKEIEYDKDIMKLTYNDVYSNIRKIWNIIESNFCYDEEDYYILNKTEYLYHYIENGITRATTNYKYKMYIFDLLHCLSYVKGYHLETYSKKIKNMDSKNICHESENKDYAYDLGLNGMLFTYNKDIWYEYVYDDHYIENIMKDKNKECDIIKRYPTFNTDYGNIILRVKHVKN